MKYRKWFETIEDAEKYAKENNITKYVFYTPEFLENGVELAYDENTIQIQCDKCGYYFEVEESAEFGYCPCCENDQVEVKTTTSFPFEWEE